ncbi:hypothetical protein TRIUR3_25375 [Triticum urartu]|uniref:Uncharacterized protein n=1 Tax=Triticum urartu TaxID=4572 RepID=M8AXZ7_TRIUA|nr:hypothetical protein TRIUR3_25375 [Triticum urartu]
MATATGQSRRRCTDSRPSSPSTRPGTRPTKKAHRKPSTPPTCKTRLAARRRRGILRGTARSASKLATATTHRAPTKLRLITGSGSTPPWITTTTQPLPLLSRDKRP